MHRLTPDSIDISHYYPLFLPHAIYTVFLVVFDSANGLYLLFFSLSFNHTTFLPRIFLFQHALRFTARSTQALESIQVHLQVHFHSTFSLMLLSLLSSTSLRSPFPVSLQPLQILSRRHGNDCNLLYSIFSCPTLTKADPFLSLSTPMESGFCSGWAQAIGSRQMQW